MKLKKRITDIIFVFLICTLILSVAAATIFLPKRSFSQKENRPLANAPELSAKGLINGSYFEAFSLFVKDQIPLRDAFVSAHSVSELLFGKMQVNGIIASKGNILIALPQHNTEKIKNSIQKIQSITQNRAIIYTPPRSIDIFSSALPVFYDYGEQTEIFSVLPENTQRMLKSYLSYADHNDYYKTDHHWTTDGAFRAYKQICDELNIKAFEPSHFTKNTVTTSFRGTSFSRSGLPEFAVDAEKILLYRYDGDINVSVINHETTEETKGFYSYSALEASDKYKLFLGGNYSHLSIKAASDQEKPKLLLIKDSFANSLIPFLALHYDIEAIDPRYCAKSFLEKCLAEDGYNDILVLLSLDTLDDIF